MSDEARRQAGDPARLETLQGYDVLDTPPEPRFDSIVQLASQACNAPIALVTLVDAERQWFKARSGLDLGETVLDQSVCAHALGQRDLLVIPDLTKDPRTRNNPLVTGGSHLRFYAGAPLVAPNGHVLGTLCVVDDVARPDGLAPGQAALLSTLARDVMRELELRRPDAPADPEAASSAASASPPPQAGEPDGDGPPEPSPPDRGVRRALRRLIGKG